MWWKRKEGSEWRKEGATREGMQAASASVEKPQNGRKLILLPKSQQWEHSSADTLILGLLTRTVKEYICVILSH